MKNAIHPAGSAILLCCLQGSDGAKHRCRQSQQFRCVGGWVLHGQVVVVVAVPVVMAVIVMMVIMVVVVVMIMSVALCLVTSHTTALCCFFRIG